MLAEGEYDFEFNIDPGQYCLIAEYIDGDGEKIQDEGMALSVKGKLYPNQFFGGFAGLVCLSLSGFAFVGAQRHGAARARSLLSNRYRYDGIRPCNHFRQFSCIRRYLSRP